MNSKLQPLIVRAREFGRKAQPYSLAIFLSIVGVIYGVSLLRIQSLNSQEPSPIAISDQVKAARIPKVDPKLVEQLNSLEDNSVSVKALFDEARQNPFEN